MSHMHMDMDMVMSTTSAAMASMTSAATATTSASSMDMDMSSSMAMYFVTSTSTPLWSQKWTPGSVGAYAGTCIFLIVFALISRLIGLARHRMEQKWHDATVRRRYITVADKDLGEGQVSISQLKGNAENGVLTTMGIDETVRIIETRSRAAERPPFRLSTDVPRAFIYIVQAGVGYLLMLAVMTFNVGYFMSVLGGLFLGELLVGRYTAGQGLDH